MHNFYNDSSKKNPELNTSKVNKSKSKQVTFDDKITKIDDAIKHLHEKRDELQKKEQEKADIRKSKFLYLINEEVFSDASKDIGKSVKIKQIDGTKIEKKITRLAFQNCVQRILKNALEVRNYEVSDFDKK